MPDKETYGAVFASFLTRSVAVELDFGIVWRRFMVYSAALYYEDIGVSKRLNLRVRDYSNSARFI